MTQRAMSDAEKHVRAVEAARRMVSAGERPAYRLRALPDRSWAVDGLPGVVVAASSRRDAPKTGRAAIAAVLEVRPDAFDVET